MIGTAIIVGLLVVVAVAWVWVELGPTNDVGDAWTLEPRDWDRDEDGRPHGR